MKIRVCTCDQCKSIKNKRSNRRNKARIRRYINRLRRKAELGKVFTYYWA